MIIKKDGSRLEPTPEKLLVLETAMGLYETTDMYSRNGDDEENRMMIGRRGAVPDFKTKEIDAKPVIFQLASGMPDDMSKEEFLEAAKRI